MEEKKYEELAKAVTACLNEVVRLRQEKESLQKQMEAALQTQQKLLSVVSNTEKNLENLKYEWNDPGQDRGSFYYPRFYKIEETVEMLVQDRKSLARFGDGEFAMMSGKERCRFQKMEEELSERLREVIACEDDGFLVGISNQYGSLEAFNWEGKYGIRPYMTDAVRREHRRFLNLDRIYHDAFISRPYAIYADNSTDGPGQRFRNLKRIWNGRDVIFAEGALTRMGVGNDLFDNAASVRRIVAPPVDAWACYQEILSAALRFAGEDVLFLIALGPSAGVLAYDLFRAGYQALDIGHLDLEYEWYLRGTGGRCVVEHKYNNELAGGDQVADIQDEAYLSQIVYVAGLTC
ncbi:MAG: DUF1792 domain-containing protein [Lachnospiraceae bacterium]|jgi:glycosyltransferase family protein|nr:DUF1792 domain-containing protein [Lachnospiraceae bacterium]